MSNDNRSPSPSNLGAIILIIVIVVGVLYLLSSGILYSLLSGSIRNTANPTVTVSGNVQTQGLGTHPVSITFGSSTVPVSNGTYSVSLQNNQQYSVVVAWSGAAGVNSGTCSAGTLNLQSSSSYYHYNVSC